jgi:hypothetical protein
VARQGFILSQIGYVPYTFGRLPPDVHVLPDGRRHPDSSSNADASSPMALAVAVCPAAGSLHGALISGQHRVIVRDVAPVPGTPAAWSVGLGFTAGVDARARIERYAAR